MNDDDDALRKARESDELTEVEGKPGLFVVESLTPKQLHGEAYYLDLRDGVSFYGYTDTGEPIKKQDQQSPPKIVKEIEAHYQAQGTAKLNQFATDG